MNDYSFKRNIEKRNNFSKYYSKEVKIIQKSSVRLFLSQKMIRAQSNWYFIAFGAPVSAQTDVVISQDQTVIPYVTPNLSRQAVI